MTAAPKIPPLSKSHCRDQLTSRTPWISREADVSREVTGTCNGRSWRGMGPSAHARTMEITSGRTVCQQGLAATCKDPSVEAKAIVDERRSVLRMSPYER